MGKKSLSSSDAQQAMGAGQGINRYLKSLSRQPARISLPELVNTGGISGNIGIVDLLWWSAWSMKRGGTNLSGLCWLTGDVPVTGRAKPMVRRRFRPSPVSGSHRLPHYATVSSSR